MNWQRRMEGLDGIEWIGADIVPDIIAQNKAKWPSWDFRVLDITVDELPPVDLVLCRDLLGHFSNRDIQLALRNIRRSRAKYLLATTFPGRSSEGNIETGQWRPINLARLYGLPNPEVIINEGCMVAGGAFADKSLGLWRLDGR